MGDSDKVTSLIYDALAEHFEQIDSDQPAPRTPDAVLFGENALLDSLGLVNVVVAVEEKLLDTFDKDVCLSDERALSLPESPYRTVDSLSRYVALLLSEAEG